MYVIYHSADLDGIFSGAIVKYFKSGVELVPYNYGEPIPELEPNRPVVICDVSFPVEDLDRISLNSYLQTVWIDHHKSAIDEFADNVENYKFLKHVKTHLSLEKSGCELTWEYFFPDKPVPFLVQCIADYDVWKGSEEEQWESLILPVQYGSRFFYKTPEDVDFFYESLPIKEQAVAVMNDIGTIGTYLWEWEKDRFKQLAKKSFRGEVKETKESCVFVNAPNVSSQVFDYIENKEVDFCIAFSLTQDGYKFSVYSPFRKLDCSKFAKRYKGGGHLGASGFSYRDFDSIFNINKEPNTEEETN